MPRSMPTTPREALAPFASRRHAVTLAVAGLLAVVRPGPQEDATAKKRKHRRKRRKHRNDPQSTPRLAASCSIAETLNFGLVAPQRLAQTFTAAASGNLIRAELAIEKEADSLGDYFLHLAPVDNFGVPTNDVLAVAPVTNQAVPAGTSTVSFSFPSPAALTAGVQFALVLNRSGTDLMGWRGVTGDQCGGLSFKSANQTAPFTSFGEGLDLIFRAFVR